MMPISADQIKKRMFKEIFDQALMDNSMRGYWCEYMIAEALGDCCKTVGAGWHAWDLEIGESEHKFPKRIRIQVKNSARLQVWNTESGKLSDCGFKLPFRKKPSYFETDYAKTPCEEFGFMCDLFILCFHKCEKLEDADQTDPEQWEFYLVPVVGDLSVITDTAWSLARKKVIESGKPACSTRKSDTLKAGTRGWPPIMPISIGDLNIETVRASLGLSK